MGYKRKRKIFNLKFQDPEFAGLEVRVKSPTLGRFIEVANLGDVNVASPTPQVVNTMVSTLVDVIVSWNLEDDDDQPIPVTDAALRDLDPDFLGAVFEAWGEAVAEVPAPLADSSSSGRQLELPEVLLPVEILSSSQAS